MSAASHMPLNVLAEQLVKPGAALGHGVEEGAALGLEGETTLIART